MADKKTPLTLGQDIGGMDIQYLLYEGDGPTIVLLHATGFSPWLWHPISRSLAPDYRVVAPYFCDHRESDPEKGGLEWLLLSEDLYRFCHELKIQDPLFVGHSMGATIMTLANANHGPLAEKMILMEPIFLPSDFYRIKLKVGEHPLASKSIKRRNHWESRKDAFDEFKAKPFFQSWDPEALDLYIQHGIEPCSMGGVQLSCSPDKEASLFMGGVQYDPWPLLPEVSCPVLVVEGELSENRPFIDLHKAANDFPDGGYKMVKGAGHLIPMEKPGEAIGIIRSFFAR